MEKPKKKLPKTAEQVPDALNRSHENEHLSGSRPVAYGSSTQTDGHGNRSRPQDTDKQNPDSKN
ncbi:hypothetical protein [Pedobacter sp. ASV12]|uniref:hypothetical protein n=1 Tax=Pedobacter sp. ASV12 TaxID=2795120 RepID=UPI0018EDFC16|nr:hypothetical protein [Pedobacter sp. ASV12]